MGYFLQCRTYTNKAKNHAIVLIDTFILTNVYRIANVYRLLYSISDCRRKHQRFPEPNIQLGRLRARLQGQQDDQ